MRLAIDVRETCRLPLTGKGRWTAGFVSALHAAGIQMTLFTDQELPSTYAEQWKNADVRIVRHSGIRWHLQVKRAILNDHSITAYVSTVSYIVPCLLRGRRPCITVVHDLIAFRDEPHDKRASFIEHVTLQIALRHSSLICTVSDTTKDDLMQKFPQLSDHTIAIYAGCDRPIATAPLKGTGSVVCIGTLCPRKNQLRLIHAHAMLPDNLREKHPLILIGSRGWSDDPILDAVHATEHVSWKGKISDDERDQIMRDAVLCAFPSLYEGFGLPVLEAFASGVPVLTSHSGSLAEVAGDGAFIVDPTDETSIMNGLQTMLTDPALRVSYAEKGLKRASVFTWKKTADLFLQALQHIDI